MSDRHRKFQASKLESGRMWETIKIPGLCKKDGRKRHVRYIAHVLKKRKITSNYKQTQKNQEEGGSTQLYSQKTPPKKQTKENVNAHAPSQPVSPSDLPPKPLDPIGTPKVFWKMPLLSTLLGNLVFCCCSHVHSLVQLAIKMAFCGWQRWGGEEGLELLLGGSFVSEKVDCQNCWPKRRLVQLWSHSATNVIHLPTK